MKGMRLALIGCVVIGVLLAAVSAPPANAARSSADLRAELMACPYCLTPAEVRQLLNKWWYLSDAERNVLREVAEARGVYKQNQGPWYAQNDDDACPPCPLPWQQTYYQNCYQYPYRPAQTPVYAQPPRPRPAPVAPVVNPTYLTVDTPWGPVQVLVPPPAPVQPPVVTLPPAPAQPPVCVLPGGGGWGTFGTYDNWARAFRDEHGRWPEKQDEADFWASQNYAAHTGYSPW